MMVTRFIRLRSHEWQMDNGWRRSIGDQVGLQDEVIGGQLTVFGMSIVSNTQVKPPQVLLIDSGVTEMMAISTTTWPFAHDSKKLESNEAAAFRTSISADHTLKAH